MTIGIRIDSAKGVVSTNNANGLVVERTAGNQGFTPYKVFNTYDVVLNTTLTANDAGVVTLSASAPWNALTIVLPLASTVPGALFTFRSLSAQKHLITASLEAGLGRVICSYPTITSSQQPIVAISGASGSQLQFGGGNSVAPVGTSVTLLCDGVSFLILGGSGSLSVGL